MAMDMAMELCCCGTGTKPLRLRDTSTTGATDPSSWGEEAAEEAAPLAEALNIPSMPVENGVLGEGTSDESVWSNGGAGGMYRAARRAAEGSV